jgi:hypothetical protein
MALYGNDGFHPSPKGSAIAAMVVYASLFQKKELNFLQLEKIPWDKELTRQEFEILRESARKAIENE